MIHYNDAGQEELVTPIGPVAAFSYLLMDGFNVPEAKVYLGDTTNGFGVVDIQGKSSGEYESDIYHVTSAWEQGGLVYVTATVWDNAASTLLTSNDYPGAASQQDMSATHVRQYRFDAFSLWGMNAPNLPQAIEDVLHEAYPDWHLDGRSMALDPWLRGVIALNETQAARMQTAVDAWNDANDGEYNPYLIAFDLATGTEHTIEVTGPNGHTSTSWQW